MLSLKKSKFIITMIALTITSVTVAQPSVKTDENQIRENVATMEKGWNSKDGKLFSSPFAAVHDFIVWNGYYFPNQTQEMNAMAHQGLFDGPYRNTDLHLKVDKIKMMSNELALVHVIGSTYEKNSAVPENPAVIMTMIMEKKDKQWQIISFHNCDLEAFSNKETAERSPMPLEVMYAGWFKK
ncbi:MAG TPA: SgcJ/EcaC family oxidoreductase [Chitinophagales bacterium]|nr:SgcJ/EcaC family oxidoreductase [Chitinophagales bacterium]